MDDTKRTALITKYKTKVVHAVGYSDTDTQGVDLIEELMQSCIDDMLGAGVHETILENNRLVFPTFIIFVTDNLAMNSGTFVTSSLYNANVSKMRWAYAGE